MRLRTLPLSLAGVVLGIFIGVPTAASSSLSLGLCIAFLLLTTVSLQILSNLSNELGDTLQGTDNDARTGIHYSLQDGQMSIAQIKRFIALMVVLCCIFGLAMIRFSFGTLIGWWQLALMFLGAAAIVAAMRYTLGKSPYGYRGWGDLFVFIFFGLVSVLGAIFVLDHRIETLQLLPACAIGFFSVGVLNTNNIRDIETDVATRVTVAMKLGRKRAVVYQFTLIVLGWVLTLSYILLSAHWWSLSCLLTLPLYIKHLRGVRLYDGKALDACLPLLVKSTFLLSLLEGVGMLF